MKRFQTSPVSEFGDPKRAKMLRAIAEDAPSKLNLFRRVYNGGASPRQAIKAQCLHCCWMDEAGIRDCTATQCPLWGLRPFQKSHKVEAASKGGA
jgi:hypothetical protein